jgi:hypothetical protein
MCMFYSLQKCALTENAEKYERQIVKEKSKKNKVPRERI